MSETKEETPRKRLYVATLEIELCVVATSKDEAMRIADQSLAEEVRTSDPHGSCVYATAIIGEGALPDGWDADSTPYGDRSKSVGEWLAAERVP